MIKADSPILHLYIEPRDTLNVEEVRHLIHDNLMAIDPDYKQAEDGASWGNGNA